MSKIKILFSNDLTYGGGVEKLMYDLVWALHEKYDITVMSYFFDENFYEKYPQDVKYICESVKIEYRSNFFIHVMSSLNRRIYEATHVWRVNKRKFDVLLCMKEGTTMRGALRYDIPRKFCWNHTDYNAYYYTQTIYGSAEKELEAMKHFEKIVCVSEDIKKGIIDVVGNPGNLEVKYNPINADKILDMSNEIVDDLEQIDVDESSKKIRFISVGRLNMQKGFDLLIAACKFLEEEGYNFEVIVVGGPEYEGEEARRLEKLKKVGDVKSIKFIGSRSNAYKYMKKADWFISSSLFEGYSLVSQEAALLDIPMILTDCSGVRELLGDGEYGIVCPISVYGLYSAMKSVLNKPELHDYYKKKIMARKAIITYEDRIAAIEAMIRTKN